MLKIFEAILSPVLGIILYLLQIHEKNSTTITIILLLFIFIFSFHYLSSSRFFKKIPSQKKRILKFSLAFVIILILVCFWYWLAGTSDKQNILKVSLSSGLSDYIPGTQVNGIKWEKGYQEYTLEFLNDNENYDLFDLRADIYFPWVIVQYEIEKNHGTQDLKLSQQFTNRGGITGKGNNSIAETIDWYINTFDIDSVKIFPKGNFSIRLIARTRPSNNDGTITFNYKYLNNKHQIVKKSSALLIKHQDKNSLYIDNNNPILSGQTYQSSFISEPKKGIIFFHPNGSITYDKNFINPHEK